MATPGLQQDQLSADEAAFLTTVENDLKSKLASMVVVGTIAIWLAVFVGAIYCLFKGAALQDQFIKIAAQVLLPLYQSTAAVVLAYIFGKPTARALARRIGIKG